MKCWRVFCSGKGWLSGFLFLKALLIGCHPWQTVARHKHRQMVALIIQASTLALVVLTLPPLLLFTATKGPQSGFHWQQANIEDIYHEYADKERETAFPSWSTCDSGKADGFWMVSFCMSNWRFSHWLWNIFLYAFLFSRPTLQEDVGRPKGRTCFQLHFPVFGLRGWFFSFI